MAHVSLLLVCGYACLSSVHADPADTVTAARTCSVTFDSRQFGQKLCNSACMLYVNNSCLQQLCAASIRVVYKLGDRGESAIALCSQFVPTFPVSCAHASGMSPWLCVPAITMISDSCVVQCLYSTAAVQRCVALHDSPWVPCHSPESGYCSSRVGMICQFHPSIKVDILRFFLQCANNMNT